MTTGCCDWKEPQHATTCSHLTPSLAYRLAPVQVYWKQQLPQNPFCKQSLLRSGPQGFWDTVHSWKGRAETRAKPSQAHSFRTSLNALMDVQTLHQMKLLTAAGCYDWDGTQQGSIACVSTAPGLLVDAAKQGRPGVVGETWAGAGRGKLRPGCCHQPLVVLVLQAWVQRQPAGQVEMSSYSVCLLSICTGICMR